ncbi:MAG: SRPBCC domain-containing protein [Bacteriovoracia bacterium]
MKNELTLTRSIPAPRDEVFIYWTEPKLLEKWAFPKGMRLTVAHFEAKAGGKYRFEHAQGEDVYLCNGHFEEFVPNEKLVQVDKVDSPEKGLLFENLKSTILLKDEAGGTRVEVTQNGFPDQKSANECKVSWEESLNNLHDLITHRRFRPGQDLRMHHVRGE